MKDGFVKVAAVTPNLKVADCDYNGQEIINEMKKMAESSVKLCVFPELSITGYTLRDLFLQETILENASKVLERIVDASKGLSMITVVGMPLKYQSKLYNVAVFILDGEILGLVPKTYLPNYHEFYEARQFTSGGDLHEEITILGQSCLLSTRQLFVCNQLEDLCIGAEICEDLWVAHAPSIDHAMAGATVIVNLSASDEIATKAAYRENLVKMQSAKLVSAYIYADAGEGESTTDVVYAGDNMIAEYGSILSRSKRFQNEAILSEIDVKRLSTERMHMNTFCVDSYGYEKVYFDLELEETNLTRRYAKEPFVPSDLKERELRCEEILTIQALGLKKRLVHTNAKTAVVGLSGGLDSTLALLVMVKAFDMMKKSRDELVAITMPGFGTTDRTYQNAVDLAKSLGCTLKEISIVDSVNQHFKDIGQDSNVHDVTYENCQARERTQILMDYANKTGGLVVGTGDLSEMALGWATYNGDHMSMYAVNSSIPKTLVRYLVRYYADTSNEETKHILLDILDTPVSPELLPPENGEISQKTEDLVGPYELHDFYLYYMLRQGFTPSKILRIAKLTFADMYDEEEILKWLKKFYYRFFSQQFKRSCMPDGPKVGTVALSPRGDLRMPSDASYAAWIKDLE